MLEGDVTPQTGIQGQRVYSYIVRARETLPNTAQRGKSSLVGLRESRREISQELGPYGRTGRNGSIFGRAANATMQSEEAWTLEDR